MQKDMTSQHLSWAAGLKNPDLYYWWSTFTYNFNWIQISKACFLTSCFLETMYFFNFFLFINVTSGCKNIPLQLQFYSDIFCSLLTLASFEKLLSMNVKAIMNRNNHFKVPLGKNYSNIMFSWGLLCGLKLVLGVFWNFST